MLDTSLHLQLADELMRRFASALRGAQLYASSHPLVGRNITALADTISLIHGFQPLITIGLVGEEVVVDNVPLPKATAMLGELLPRLRRHGIERIAMERGVELDEVITFIHAVAAAPPVEKSRELAGEGRAISDLPHIRVGRILLEQRVEASAADMATIRRLYSDAVSAAGLIWETAQAEGVPDVNALRAVAQGLAQAVAQNRTALLALTALKNYDNYTFTHMVNVSILTMAQARGLGVDGPLLREFGLAGLMHDIGKVRVPTEILNKPEKLTDQEFAVIKRHPVDGAEILRKTPEIPPMAAIVAFEHHLRTDGSGYPEGAVRPSLNLATQVCSVADVYDAMRSQRMYQRAFPTDRILAVLKSNDGTRFDQNLVRRFSQLMGIYPPGNLVRLNTGEVAVVLRAYAPDPYRPKVRVLFSRDGKRLEVPYDLDLWEIQPRDDRASSVMAPVDPADYQIDPLTLM
jgi:putative nucleotidyltransferase with HDIG domain